MHKLAFIGTILLALAVPAEALAQDNARTLHDTYCLMCHGTQVYTRAERIANDYAAVRDQVDRWQKNVSLNWSRADIDAVTAYLTEHYYRLPCPASC
jgi:hypothetical protein